LALRESMRALSEEGLRVGMDVDLSVAPRTTPGKQYLI